MEKRSIVDRWFHRYTLYTDEDSDKACVVYHNECLKGQGHASLIISNWSIWRDQLQCTDFWCEDPSYPFVRWAQCPDDLARRCNLYTDRKTATKQALKYIRG